MLRFLPSVGLFGGVLLFGLCASTYGQEITKAPTLKAALPLAAPFMLCAAGAAASFALCAASLCDAAEKRRTF